MARVRRDVASLLALPAVSCSQHLRAFQFCLTFVLTPENVAGGGSLTCVADTKLVCDPTQQDRGRELCKATS